MESLAGLQGSFDTLLSNITENREARQRLGSLLNIVDATLNEVLQHVPDEDFERTSAEKTPHEVLIRGKAPDVGLIQEVIEEVLEYEWTFAKKGDEILVCSTVERPSAYELVIVETRFGRSRKLFAGSQETLGLKLIVEKRRLGISHGVYWWRNKDIYTHDSTEYKQQIRSNQYAPLHPLFYIDVQRDVLVEISMPREESVRELEKAAEDKSNPHMELLLAQYAKLPTIIAQASMNREQLDNLVAEIRDNLEGFYGDLGELSI